uniref:Uncharacterized protein n=1 Tax=Rhizophora mucronata TaxID=61149 RepID=A0A2P2QVE7_RHIMU
MSPQMGEVLPLRSRRFYLCNAAVLMSCIFLPIFQECIHFIVRKTSKQAKHGFKILI